MRLIIGYFFVITALLFGLSIFGSQHAKAETSETARVEAPADTPDMLIDAAQPIAVDLFAA